MLAGEVMAKASLFLENRIHPTIVIQVCCCESIENFLMCKYFSRFPVLFALHNNLIISLFQAYRQALEDMIRLCEDKYSKPVNVDNDDEIATASLYSLDRLFSCTEEKFNVTITDMCSRLSSLAWVPR